MWSVMSVISSRVANRDWVVVVVSWLTIVESARFRRLSIMSVIASSVCVLYW